MELNLLPPTLQLNLKNIKERIYMKEVMEKAGKHLENNFIRIQKVYSEDDNDNGIHYDEECNNLDDYIVKHNTIDDYIIENRNYIIKQDNGLLEIYKDGDCVFITDKFMLCSKM